MFGVTSTVVDDELSSWARFAGRGKSVTAVLKFAGVANGTECCLIDVFTTQGTKLAGYVFGVKSVVVDDELSSLAKIAGIVDIQVGLVLIVTGWAYLTV
jgi:hypothetical protein